GKIRTISSRNVCDISEFYYPAKVKFGLRRESAANLAAILTNNPRAIISGTVGQGKSTLMRHLAIEAARQGIGLPVFIELRNIDKDTTLAKLLNTQLTYLGLKEQANEDFSDLLFKRNLPILFLDAYDEVKREFAMRTRDEVQELRSRYADLRMIISSRPSALSNHLDRLISFSYAEIASLQQEDFEPFFERIGVQLEARQRLIAAIRNSSSSIRGLLTTPLMLTLVANACANRPVLPETLPDFFDALFGVMVSAHDDTKPGFVREKATSLTNSQFESIFSCFCFVSKELFGTTSLAPRDFDTARKRAVKLTSLDCTSEGLKADAIDVVCLMVKDGLNTAFIHKSVQEFFAASFIRSLQDEEVVQGIYESIRAVEDSRKWNQELQFLKQIDNERYVKYVQIPWLDALLAAAGFDETSRVGANKRTILRWLSKLSPDLVQTRGSNQSFALSG
ncbi:MAG: NACHT domain-containing protein, partial [Proteobacteria bacterium]